METAACSLMDRRHGVSVRAVQEQRKIGDGEDHHKWQEEGVAGDQKFRLLFGCYLRALILFCSPGPPLPPPLSWYASTGAQDDTASIFKLLTRNHVFSVP
eukprot:73029-Hanusia_phi.AAC.1